MPIEKRPNSNGRMIIEHADGTREEVLLDMPTEKMLDFKKSILCIAEAFKSHQPIEQFDSKDKNNKQDIKISNTCAAKTNEKEQYHEKETFTFKGPPNRTTHEKVTFNIKGPLNLEKEIKFVKGQVEPNQEMRSETMNEEEKDELKPEVQQLVTPRGPTERESAKEVE